MKRCILFLITFSYLSLSFPIQAHSFAAIEPALEQVENSKVIEGDWSGLLEFPGGKLNLILHIQKNELGELVATLDSPDQEARGIPIDQLEITKSFFAFKIDDLSLEYQGTLSEKEDQIEGLFTQNEQTMPLLFKRGLHVEKKRQEPDAPFPYEVEEVSYLNKEDKVILSGTLTTPKASGPCPAVLLITGSGAHDRDETIYGHKPFLVLADYLTRRGIAVLRVDDRGVGGSSGAYYQSTLLDYVADILAGVEFLKSREEIDPSQIGLIGHSEGGMLAPIAASKSQDVAFLVLLAAPALLGEKTIYDQVRTLNQISGTSEEEIEILLSMNQEMFSILKKEPNFEKAEKLMGDLLIKYAENFPKLFEEKGLPHFQESLKVANTPWFRSFITTDSTPFLKRTEIPLLALNGELDVQVLPKENLSLIAKALEEAGNEKGSFVELPKLNHLFQTCEIGAIEEYPILEETFSEDALTIIADWILTL